MQTKQDHLQYPFHVEQLYAEYIQQFPKEKETLHLFKTLLQAKAQIHSRAEMAGHITAGAVILSQDKKKILLIQSSKFQNLWLFPGGHFDIQDKNPIYTALREAQEEIGISNLTSHPWHNTHHIPFDIDIHSVAFNPNKPLSEQAAHMHIDCRYIFTTAKFVDSKLDPREVSKAEWHAVEDVSPTLSVYPTIIKLKKLLQNLSKS